MPPDDIALEANGLMEHWVQALGGDCAAHAQWKNVDTGRWSWQTDGLHVSRGTSEWYSLMWAHFDSAMLRRLKRFVLGITVQGGGQAAGMSFGPYRDFMAEVSSQPVRLQLEVDASAGTWRFRLDGRVVGPAWWNSAVTTIDDILNNTFNLKARRPDDVGFRDFTIHTFRESCKISVIITCNRFLQRLRLSLRNWCHQERPSGAYEVLVVNPGNPDGTHEHLRSVARSYPEVRICEVPVSGELGRNKGAMINAAIPSCHGDWIWLTDADCIFPVSAIDHALKHATNGSRQRLLYGQRRYLTPSRTDELLAGRLDCLTGFAALSDDPMSRKPENSPWGYTQIVPRAMFSRVRYPETFDHYAHGDSHFIEVCKSRGMTPEPVPGLFCLHLDHPFAWYGSKDFL